MWLLEGITHDADPCQWDFWAFSLNDKVKLVSHYEWSLRIRGSEIWQQIDQKNMCDVAADKDPAKYCQLAIEELEMADEMYEAEEKMLHSSDDEGN